MEKTFGVISAELDVVVMVKELLPHHQLWALIYVNSLINKPFFYVSVFNKLIVFLLNDAYSSSLHISFV